MTTQIQIVRKASYVMISDKIKWNAGEMYLVGKELNVNSLILENTGFAAELDHSQVALNIVVNEMKNFIQTNQKSPILKDNYHYNPAQTLLEASEMINNQLLFLREMIFEETRKEFFPNLPSRQKCIWVIPKEREILTYWMPKLKTPDAIIYELNLTGKIHRSNPQPLEIHSAPPALIRKSAYRYWLGTMGDETPKDECIFEGLVKVEKVIDANSVG